MINSNNGYNKLKKIVVGRELAFTNKRVADFSFRVFYQENLNECVYDKLINNGNEYSIKYELLEKRNEQLDGLAKLFEHYGVEVLRPEKLTKVKSFQTPDFKSELSSASNVRDLSIVIGDSIIETPTYIQNRYFENTLLWDAFNKSFNNGVGGRWISPPKTKLTEDTMDFDDWMVDRDFTKDLSSYTMAIDGAQFLRLDDDIICNVSTYNHYLGFKWVESMFPEKTFHHIKITDNHIDGTLITLCEGKFLINTSMDTHFTKQQIIDRMPAKFKDWEYLEPEFKDRRNQNGKTDIDIQLASSRGMDINVVNIDENTIVAHDDAYDVLELLDKHGFNVIPHKLENCEIFAGGIHCSTLDIERE